MKLAEQKCEPCEGGIPPLSKDRIQSLKKELSDSWSIELYNEEEDIYGANRKLSQAFKFKDFVEAMDFVNKVADLAEEEGHHPDIEISYNKVNLTLTTHAIGGLSENDFIVAAKIDNLLN